MAVPLNHIEAKRRALKVSRVALGKALGVSSESIRRWERGLAEPSLDQLLKLASMLGSFVIEHEGRGVVVAPIQPGSGNDPRVSQRERNVEVGMALLAAQRETRDVVEAIHRHFPTIQALALGRPHDQDDLHELMRELQEAHDAIESAVESVRRKGIA